MGQKPEWLPYFGPMLAFAAMLAAGDFVDGHDVAFLALRVAVPLLVFLLSLSGGSYPELKDFRPGWGGVALDVLFGLLVMVVWVAPYMLWPGMRPDAAAAFDPDAAGAGGMRSMLLGLRFAGFVVVTPFIEELLVRSYLIRAVDVYPNDDFRQIPIGSFAWRSFVVTVAWFTLTHAQWEWPVAFLAGVLYNLWIYRRKHIGALILAHAATNAALFCLVVWGAGDPSAPDALRDLWFFL